MGFKTVIVIPETQSQEKKDMLRLAGADLVQVPAAPYKNPNNYVRYSGRLAEKLAQTEPNGAIWANQFDNVANRQAHVETTGPEIWEQTGGKVDGFVCAVGSGGTLAGVAMALQPKGVKIGLADPEGAALYSYYTTGELKSEGSSITEGIGQGRITANLEGITPDMAWRIPDSEALPIVFDLLAEEGLCMGGSTGINIAGAIRMAREMGPGHTIVTPLVRLWNALSVQALQPRLPACQGSARAGMARPKRRARCRACSSTDADAAQPAPCPLLRPAAGAVRSVLCRVAAAAQDVQEPDYKAWEDAAKRAEEALAADRVSTAALDDVRSAIVDWRAKFAQAQNANAAQIETVKSQITALGPAPSEEKPDAPEIAARRKALNDQLAKLQAPGIAAVEARSRADGLIRQIDARIRARQASELLQTVADTGQSAPTGPPDGRC